MRSLWVLVALSLLSPVPGLVCDAAARGKPHVPARSHDRHSSHDRRSATSYKPAGGGKHSTAGKGRSQGSGGGSALHSRRNSHKRGRGRHRVVFVPPPMPARIDVLAADDESGTVQVQLTGPMRPPHARLFVLTDSRGRRFIPAQAECYAIAETAAASADAPPALPRWRCAMSIAPSYRHSPLTGVSMEWGDRIVRALPGQVRARWATTGDVSVPATAEPEAGATPPPQTTAGPSASPDGAEAPVRPDAPPDAPPTAAPAGEPEPIDPAHPEPEDTRPE